MNALAHMFADSIRAIDDGRSVHEVMCRDIAVVLRANAAVYVQLNIPSQECMVTCWNQSQRAALHYVTSETFAPLERLASGGSAEAVSIWRKTLAFRILKDLIGEIEYAELPLGVAATEERLAVFARVERFEKSDLELLRCCSGPLSALDCHLLHLESTHAASVPVQTAPNGSNAQSLAGGLTSREVEVLAMLCEGLMARTMAVRLCVSTRTVNKHLGSLYIKLDVHDRLAAVRKAQLIGILPMR